MKPGKATEASYCIFGREVPRRTAHWATLALFTVAAVLVVTWVSGGFEDPVVTADALEEIGVRLIKASEDVVEDDGSFDAIPWLEEVDAVGSFLNRAGFAKDELRAAIRGLGRFSETGHRRDLELTLDHYARFHRHLESLRGM